MHLVSNWAFLCQTSAKIEIIPIFELTKDNPYQMAFLRGTWQFCVEPSIFVSNSQKATHTLPSWASYGEFVSTKHIEAEWHIDASVN